VRGWVGFVLRRRDAGGNRAEALRLMVEAGTRPAHPEAHRNFGIDERRATASYFKQVLDEKGPVLA